MSLYSELLVLGLIRAATPFQTNKCFKTFNCLFILTNFIRVRPVNESAIGWCYRGCRKWRGNNQWLLHSTQTHELKSSSPLPSVGMMP